jgi:hypothetical protein
MVGALLWWTLPETFQRSPRQDGAGSASNAE